jgi:hypothetical protein
MIILPDFPTPRHEPNQQYGPTSSAQERREDRIDIRDRAPSTKSLLGLRRIGRYLLFATLYILWPILKHIPLYKTVFLVYPGTEKDKRGYWPKGLDRFFRTVVPLGFLRLGGKTEMYAATPNTFTEMREDPALLASVLASVRSEFPCAKIIALAGQLPSAAAKANLLVEPLIPGHRGTRYAMFEACREAGIHVGTPANLTIAVIGGAGYIGSRLCHDLKSLFDTVVSYDPRWKDTTPTGTLAGAICDHRPECVADADVIINLAPRGDDFASLVDYVRDGTFVIDDTHPYMHRAVRDRLAGRGVFVLKATMVDKTLRFIPRMPGFRGDDIPGCLLEARVVAAHGRIVLEGGQCNFNAAANITGFEVRLAPHPNDG